MAFTLVTNDIIVARTASALFGVGLGSSNLAKFTALAGTNPNALLNSVYVQSVGTASTATVADVLIANLGITDATAVDIAKNFIVAQLNAVDYTLRGQTINTMLNQFSQLTSDATFGAAATAWDNKITNAVAYGNQSGNPDTTFVLASGGTSGGTTTTGQTFTLTTGVDNINGTAGNDTIIADNTSATSKTLGPADTINGGAGTDTLKVFNAAADTIETLNFGTLSNVENLYLNSGKITAAATFDASGLTGVTSVALDTLATLANATAVTIKEAATQTLSLTKVNVAAAGAATVNLSGVTAATLNAVGTDATNTGALTLDLTTTTATTLGLTTSGAASKVTLANTGAALTTLNVAGDQNLTLTESINGLKTINASTATGKVAVDASGATLNAAFAFTGGAGDDTLKLADNALANLTSGAQLAGGAGTADKLAILDTALTATETARINQTTGFEVLGLNAAITLDASSLTAIKSFSIDTTALTQTISNMSTGSTTTFTAAAPTSMTLGTSVGVTDTAVVLAGGVTVGTLDIRGISNITLTSNGTTANAITTLTNSDNSLFTVKGAQDLTLSLSAGTAVGSKIDASAFTGKGTFTGSSITTSGDVIIGGSGNDTINGGKGADTMTGGAGADTFSFTATAGANASGATFGQADVITDFVIGTDKLQFAGVVDVVSGQQAAVQTAVTALAAGSTDAQIATAMATANTTNLGVSFAVFGGNTYVLYETTGASTGVAADDVFIKLSGVSTLPTFAADVVA